MSDLNDFYAGVRAIVAATWTDLVDIWEDFQIERWPLEQIIEADRLPFAVLLTHLESTERFGADVDADEGDLVVYYVTNDAGPAAIFTVRPALEALRRALRRATLPIGQLLNRPSVSWEPSLPPNRYFVAKNVPLVCGAVIARVVVPEVEE
jgi:hypothetical protein